MNKHVNSAKGYRWNRGHHSRSPTSYDPFLAKNGIWRKLVKM